MVSPPSSHISRFEFLLSVEGIGKYGLVSGAIGLAI